MRQIFIILVLLVASSVQVRAQEVQKQVSKMDAFVSATGTMMKYIDYKLPKLVTAETKVRKIIADGRVEAFYIITKKEQYSDKNAAIAYEDLLEVIKAVAELKVQAEEDVTAGHEYLENKFVTEDGFKVGYYVSDGSVGWFMTLEKYGQSTVFVRNGITALESMFGQAKQKMEEVLK